MATATAAKEPAPQAACPPSRESQLNPTENILKAIGGPAIGILPPAPRTNTNSIGIAKTVDTTSVGLALAEALAASAAQKQHAPSHASLTTAGTPRTVSSVDIAAFAAQAAAAAHADHTAAILRRKQAAAVSVDASVTRVSVKEPKRRASGATTRGGASPTSDNSTNSTTMHSSKSLSKNGSTPGSGGGTGAAFCLIPQQYHNGGRRHGNGHAHDCEHDTGRGGGARLSSFTGSYKGNRGNTSSGSGGDHDRSYRNSGGGDCVLLPGQTREAVHKRKAAGTFRLDDASDSDGRCSGDQNMSAESRLERSREQNRQSSRKARMRRKSEEMSLKDQIEEIQIFRLMVEEGPDMMSIHGLDHRAPFRYASSAFQRVAGINPRDVLGRGLTDLIALEDHGIVQQALLKVVFSHTSDHIVSYRMQIPNGKSMVVETSIRTGDQCIICVARVVQQRNDNVIHHHDNIVNGNMCSSSNNNTNNTANIDNIEHEQGARLGGHHQGEDSGGSTSDGAGGAVVYGRSSGGGKRVRAASSRRRGSSRNGCSGEETSEIESDGDQECA